MITKITKHFVDARKRMLGQYKGKEKFEGFFDCFTTQIQELEDVIYSLFYLLDIDLMEGAQLDLIGRIVGQDREENTDAVYRILLKVRIIINTSQGTTVDAIEAFDLVRGTAEGAFRELFPCHVEFYVDDTIDATLQGYIRAVLQATVATGVKVDPVEMYDDTEPFIFASVLSTPSEGGGFSEVAHPTVGGELGKLL